MKKQLVIAILAGFFGLAASAQEADSAGYVAAVDTNQSEQPVTDDNQISDFRPIIGIEAGMLTYFGDISVGQKANSILTSNWAGALKMSFPLKSSFYISFGAMIGAVSANERSTTKNRNFHSEITAFGAEVSYNFNHFLSEKRVLDPYLSVGFDALIFNSKTDLFDGQGREYHYWTDGTIRDRAEIPENLTTAVEINRDYEYETDHRRTDVSGAGYYEKYTFAVPVGAGVNMRLSHKMHAQLGVNYYFLFSDRIDGVSAEGKGIYEGNSQNDALLFTHIGLSYDLSRRSGSADDPSSDGISDEELAAMTTGDSDYDGVADLFDKCPETPSGVEVDSVGCPFDEDDDGVPDYKDQELGSDPYAIVDSNGVTLTDEQLELIYLRFLDSNGFLSNYVDTIYTTDLPLRTRRIKNTQYSIQVDDSSLTNAQTNDLIEEGNLHTAKDKDGTHLLVGEYGTIDEALAKDAELRSKGVQTSGIVQETKTGIVVNANILGVFVGDRQGKDFEEQGKVFRIQVGAFRNEPKDGYFGDMEVIGVKNADGITRYYAGNYESYDEAAKDRQKLRAAGYGDCLIKAFEKDDSGTKITPKGVGSVSGGGAAPVGGSNDKSKVRFKVQVGTHKDAIPMEEFNTYVQLGQVKSEQGLDGHTRYFIGSYKTLEEAQAAKKKIDEIGSLQSTIAGEYDGKTIPVQEAMDILEQ